LTRGAQEAALRTATIFVASSRLTMASDNGYPSSRVALQIPRRYIDPIAAISRLPDTTVEELIRAFESVPIERNPEKATALIVEMVQSIAIEELGSIVDAVYALYRVREFTSLSQRGFVFELVESIRSQCPDAITAGDVGRVRERFEQLLSIEHLGALSKAFRLQREGERLYCEAKILSDIRPIFEGDGSAKPENAVITHALKVNYHEGAELKEFFVVLDREDLNALRSVIDRAIVKDGTLRKFLEEGGVQDLGI